MCLFCRNNIYLSIYIILDLHFSNIFIVIYIYIQYLIITIGRYSSPRDI